MTTTPTTPLAALDAQVRRSVAALRTGPAVRVLRRYTWPYKALTSLRGKELAAVWLAATLAWLVGWVVFSGVHPLIRVPAGVLTLLAGAGVLGALTYAWITYRHSPDQLTHLLLARDGFAGYREVERAVGTHTTRAKAPVIRPRCAAAGVELDAPDVAWRLGQARTSFVWVLCEQGVYLVGPPRSGKGFGVLTAAIIEAPGAVVTTSTRTDNMEATIAARAEKGQVFLFDPERVSGRATTLRWSPINGCEDPVVAQRRAATLVGRTGLGEGENAPWAVAAAGIIQCLLHAAAIAGRTVHDLHAWSTSPARAREAVALLEHHTPDGWGIHLESIQNEDPRMRSNKWFGVETAFKALDVAEVRAMFDVAPDDADAFDPEAFLTATATLYLVSRWREGSQTGASVGGFFSVLLDDIAEAARRLSQRPEYQGRLDPPATFVLDEIANIHPWPSLPRAMSAGGGEGLQVVVAFQSRSQAREAYGDDVERSMWESAYKLLLGGGSDEADLAALSRLLGQEDKVQLSTSWQGLAPGTHSTQHTSNDLISPHELRRLPEGVALLLAGRARPILVQLDPWPSRSWAHKVHASKAWHRDHPVTPGVPAPLYSGHL